jgi:hypothetical protein
MDSLMSRSRLAIGALALVLVSLAGGCSTPARPVGLLPGSPPPATPVEATELSAPSPSIAASAAIAAGPPVAALAAEGGDPTDGQLGTYVWGDGGSDGPWLRGARVEVGSGEPLVVSFRPDETVATWSARSVPSTADGPAGATVLGEGSGQPRFPAPQRGTWTVEVHVVFAANAGSASYFWQLAVD